jgi:bacteriorhodopsin
MPATVRMRLRFHADEHTIEREENNKMTEETQTGKDYFWIYVALATAALVGVVVMAKLSENEKYDPIRAQQNEEVARMNIRVLN